MVVNRQSQLKHRRWRNRFLALAWLIGFVSAGVSESEAQPQTPVDLELVLAIDISRSVDQTEAQLQRSGYIAAFRDPELIQAIQSGILGRIAVGYFEWAGFGHNEVIIGWTLIEDAASAHAFAAKLEQEFIISASRTSISSAIEFARPWFDDNGFEGSRRVIDISGDGPNNWGELVTSARDRAVAAGITINGLPILNNRETDLFSRFNIGNLDLYYRDCVIGGAGAFTVVAADFKDFARAVRRKLVLEIAGIAPPPGGAVITIQADDNTRVSPPCDIGETLWRNRDGF